MSLETFMQKFGELVSEGHLDEEIAAGLVLRIEVSAEGIQVEGVRSEAFCPGDIRDGRS